MNPLPLPHQSDSDSLQADVMRFMAIIAFCLIAILALVKHAEPAESQPQATPTTAQSAEAEPKVAVSSTPRQPPAPTWQQPMPKPTPEGPPPEPTRKPMAETKRLAAAEVTPRPDSVSTTSRDAAADAEPSKNLSQQREEESGLSLRFASNGDFLRLIARGDIGVYAFQGSDVLSLSSSYDFLSARSPGQLYELMPQTIPGIVYNALAESRGRTGDVASYSWGVTLPTRIQDQIRGYLGTAKHGQLVINRYGEVRHVD